MKDSAPRISAAGLVSLAVAMGVGRFAFTPILPMMMDDYGITTIQGSGLAVANYIGYLAGALAAVRLRLAASAAITISLAVIVFSTSAMAFDAGFAPWAVLRFAAGAASAWVIISVSAWSLERLAGLGASRWNGVVFAGVGAGIAVAGAACAALMMLRASAAQAWITLAALSLLGTGWVHRVLQKEPGAARFPQPAGFSLRDAGSEFWRLVFSYGCFGFGYILPATFLPVMAKRLIGDARVFGLAWPAFGVAAVVSTLTVSARLSHVRARAVWITANLVMAVGLLVLAVGSGWSGPFVAAMCVGGTFMVITMAGMEEARRVGGLHAKAYMATLTAAFATGQVIGPFLAGVLNPDSHAFGWILGAAGLLLIAASALLVNRSRDVGER